MARASSRLPLVEQETPPRRTVVLGIDPGRSTGLYCASIPTLDRALTLPEFERDARWLGNAAVALSTRESALLTQRWAEMQERISNAVHGAHPALIVLEYPADGMSKWSGGTARGIDFGMGMFFGFAALAAEQYASKIGGLGSCPIALMPVTSSKAKGRVGWMPKVTERSKNGKRVVTHTQDRETTLRQCRQIAHSLGENSGLNSEYIEDNLSEHELMALGVLTYYVTNRHPRQWGE